MISMRGCSGGDGIGISHRSVVSKTNFRSLRMTSCKSHIDLPASSYTPRSVELLGNESHRILERRGFNSPRRLARLVGSSVDDGDVELVSDAPQCIDPLLRLPSSP